MMQKQTKPIEHCYWVEPNKLLAGEYPRNIDEKSSQKKINALLSFGVTVFIDLTEKDDKLSPYSNMIGEATHLQFPIKDASVPESTKLTTTVLDTIDKYIEQGEMVYVHCWGGVGRTGVIIACWLARHGYKGDKTLSRLRELWQQCPKSKIKQSPETFEQEKYILNFAENCGI